VNLRQIEVFRAIMQTGSVKGAAELLHVSPPAVSKLLATAERRSGLRLFERAKGRLIATPEATQLYEQVDRMWAGVERIRVMTEELRNPTAGSLRLAISPSLGATVVPQAATQVSESTPHARLHVDLLIPHLLVQALVDGAADLGLSLSPQDHPSLQVLSRYPCGLVCVMPAGHALARKETVRASDLRDHRVISFPQALLYGVTPQDLYGRYAAQIQTGIEVRSGQTACWFSLAGGGVAIVDATAVAGAAFPGLVVRPYQCRARLELRLLRHRHRPLSKLAETFCATFDQTWNRLLGGRSRSSVAK